MSATLWLWRRANAHQLHGPVKRSYYQILGESVTRSFTLSTLAVVINVSQLFKQPTNHLTHTELLTFNHKVRKLLVKRGTVTFSNICRRYMRLWLVSACFCGLVNHLVGKSCARKFICTCCNNIGFCKPQT